MLLSRLAAGESGSADTVRDPRGFAVKFYTEEGNWDLTGNNTPIFFIKDALLVSVGSQLACSQLVAGQEPQEPQERRPLSVTSTK